MTTDAVQILLDLLEQEKALLIGGKLEDAAALEVRKVELADEIAGQGAPEDILRDLQQKARRNQELLEASRRGLKTAGARIVVIRKAMTQLDTYSANGGLRKIETPKPSVERRA